jgi:hypothetical protein
MAYGPNRAASRTRATFQTAGGTTIRYRHPFLSGQISGASTIDEIDVSRALRLNDTYLSAQPAQDSSFQEVLVDGSIIVITNHLLAGVMNLNVLRTTGLVGTGDFIAALQLVQASKDDVGGTLTHIETINGKRIITIFYGVSIKHVPHLIKAGNAVVPYPVQLAYAGWVQGVGAVDVSSEKTIWAVGNSAGLKGTYTQYDIQTGENAGDFFGGAPVTVIGGVDADEADDSSADLTAIVSTSAPPGGYPNVIPDPSDPNPGW